MSGVDGGPAFPSHGAMGEVAHEGMTLRDYFAAKAMQALLHSVCDKEAPEQVKNVANGAYQMADDMLKARSS